MKQLILLVSLFSSSLCFSQQVLTEEVFLEVVKEFHPVAKGAALGIRIAKAELLTSRGAFDPVLRSSSSRKEFDGTTYYDDRQTEIKIPTWYGVDIYAGTEVIRGQRVNPEETNGAASYLGVSVPVLQNLLLDKRRAALQQARIAVDFSGAERASMLNNLLLDAVHAYWEWWQAYHLLQLVESSLKNVRGRFVLVKNAYHLGDRPAIDTVEALTQVQAFEVTRADMYTRLVKAQVELFSYLWRHNNEPYDLPSATVPQADTRTAPMLLETLLHTAMDHPDLQQYNFKLASLQLERRLKFQSLLPDMNLKYNQLAKGQNLLQTAKAPLFQNDYRFGISISTPLRFSAGRGELQKAKLKIELTTLDRAAKQVQIQTKVRQYFTEWQQTTQQLLIQANAVDNYTTLQKGEEIRFANGESSLFFVNAREQKSLESRQKWIELQAKNRRAMASVKWAAGLMQ